jgi:hypothetical protein
MRLKFQFTVRPKNLICIAIRMCFFVLGKFLYLGMAVNQT